MLLYKKVCTYTGISVSFKNKYSFKIGGIFDLAWNNGGDIKGWFDDLYIYNRAISEAEVSLLYGSFDTKIELR